MHIYDVLYCMGGTQLVVGNYHGKGRALAMFLTSMRDAAAIVSIDRLFIGAFDTHMYATKRSVESVSHPVMRRL